MTRVFIQDVFNITGIGPVAVGKVEVGTLRIGMKATLEGNVFEVTNLEMHHERVQEAKVGESVGIGIKLVDRVLPQNTPIQPKPSFLKRLFSAFTDSYEYQRKMLVGKSVEFV